MVDWFDLIYFCLMPLSAIFQLYLADMVTSFSDGRSWSTRREPPTMGKQLVNLITFGCESSAPFFFTSPGRPGELLSSLSVRRPSVNISHFNLLLRNHRANCNQTLVEWSLDGPLPKLCSVIPTSNQNGHQPKNRRKGGWNFNCPLLL
jgi:hypothetical protein